MTFRDRLQAMDEFTCAAAPQAPNEVVQLCHPQVIRMEGEVLALARGPAASLLVGAVGSHRLLCAVADLLVDFVRAAELVERDPVRGGAVMTAVMMELIEAGAVLDLHTTSAEAAMAIATREHEDQHTREANERGPVH